MDSINNFKKPLIFILNGQLHHVACDFLKYSIYINDENQYFISMMVVIIFFLKWLKFLQNSNTERTFDILND